MNATVQTQADLSRSKALDPLGATQTPLSPSEAASVNAGGQGGDVSTRSRPRHAETGLDGPPEGNGSATGATAQADGPPPLACAHDR